MIYVPYEKLSGLTYPDASPEEKLAHLGALAQISVTEGEIGYIVRVLRWK